MNVFRFAAVSAATFVVVGAASAASAMCTVYQNPGYGGQSMQVDPNSYVRFDGNAPARALPTTDNHWWHNRVSGVKMTAGCKAVFFGSHGSKYTHFIIDADTKSMVSGQGDLTQGVICECN